MSRLTGIILISGCLQVMIGAPREIGTVRSLGEFRVDGAAIRGNGTLFDGDVIETASVRSVILLEGSEITLLPESRLKVFRDHAVLERGSGLVKGGGSQVIVAGTVRIGPSTTNSVIQVERAAPGHVAVAARTGSAEVHNAGGSLVALVRPGMALAFEPQAGGAPSVKLSGTLQSRDGKYYVTDTTSHITVELQGNDLASYVGRNVDIQGSTIPDAVAAGGASSVVRVATISPHIGAAGAAGAGGAGGASASGLSGAALGAIIGGVAVGGTFIGLAAAGTFSGSSSGTTGGITSNP